MAACAAALSRSTCREPPPTPLGELFAPPVADVWLEIGFGGGEHLLWQARAQPGCRPDRLRAVPGRGRQGAERHRGGADRQCPAACRRRPSAPAPAARGQHRPRLHPVPRSLAEEAPPQAPARVGGHARRACPHHARRARELRIATDIGEYARWMLLAVRGQAAFAWTATRPGRLALAAAPIGRQPATSRRPCREGRRCYYFRFAAKSEPAVSYARVETVRQSSHFPLAIRHISA